MCEKAKHILIIDYYCNSNRGDWAILHVVKEKLLTQFPGSEICVHSRYPELVKEFHHITSHYPLFHIYSRKSLVKGFVVFILCTLWTRLPFLRRISGYVIGKTTLESLQDYNKADIVVGMGGSFYHELYLPGSWGRLMNLHIAHIMKKQLVIVGHSVASFTKIFFRCAARHVFKRIKKICLRERQSHEIMRRLGLDNNILLTADLAFLHTSTPAARPDLLHDEKIPVDKPYVSISIREWKFYQGDNEQKKARLISCIRELADHLITQYGCNVLFISTCTGYGGYRNSDIPIAEATLHGMRQRDRAYIVRGEYTPAQIQQLYSQSLLHIGMRLHSLIFALNGHTPIIALSTEQKTEGIMADFGLEDCCLKVEDIDLSLLKELCKKIMSDRPRLIAHIEEQIKAFREKAQMNIDAVTSLLR